MPRSNSLRARARAEGIEEGLTRATHDADALAAILRDGMAKAQASARATQDAVETLAIGVARLALRALLGDAQWRSDAQALAICQACAALQVEGPCRVRVAAHDFPYLAAMRRVLDAGFELIADPALESGACLVELDGCAIDAALAGQLARLEALLAAEASRG